MVGHRSGTKEYLAELAGTFLLVFVGTGAVVAATVAAGGHPFGVLEYIGVGMAFGVALMVAAYTVGPVSGAHFNPAVTLALAVEKRISREKVLPYIVAQCAGALLASAALWGLLGTKAYGLGETTVGAFGFREAMWSEGILTGILVFTVLGVTEKSAPAGFAGLIIGLYLAASHLVGIPLSGNSLNPARSLGPAVFVGGAALHQLLQVYVLAPIAGALAGALGYRWVKSG